jgi:hypothetical protein
VGDTVDFGVDLYRLWLAGEVLLPQVATVYEGENQDLHNTGFWEAGAFDRLGTTSPVAAPWQELRDGLVRLFAHTAMTLDLTGVALRRIASDYSQMDADAAAVMRQQIDSYRANAELPQAPGPIDVELPANAIETEIGADGVEVPVR